MKKITALFLALFTLNVFAGDQSLVCINAQDVNGDEEFLAMEYIEDRAEVNFNFKGSDYKVMADITTEPARMHVVKSTSDNIDTHMFDFNPGWAGTVKISSDVECAVVD